MRERRRYRVRGRVQGVSYRAFARSEAQALGLTGHARNHADGSVEVLVIGTPDALLRLESWLWRGPPAALVDSVELELQESVEPQAEAEPGFRIG
ncbi:MAG: acylphosphatase [Ahniella sp.]|nr:acylphosphatase [Ahniella sp.]